MVIQIVGAGGVILVNVEVLILSEYTSAYLLTFWRLLYSDFFLFSGFLFSTRKITPKSPPHAACENTYTRRVRISPKKHSPQPSQGGVQIRIVGLWFSVKTHSSRGRGIFLSKSMVGGINRLSLPLVRTAFVDRLCKKTQKTLLDAPLVVQVGKHRQLSLTKAPWFLLQFFCEFPDAKSYKNRIWLEQWRHTKIPKRTILRFNTIKEASLFMSETLKFEIIHKFDSVFSCADFSKA